MKKLIMASAFLAALCLPALACGPAIRTAEIKVARAIKVIKAIKAAVAPMACPGRSLVLDFLSSP